MTTTSITCTVPPTSTDAGVPAAEQLVQALAQRDFAALRDCLDAGARMRALVPRGPLEVDGSEAVAAKFQTWFGAQHHFELLDASVGRIGKRTYLRWRLRVAEAATPQEALVVEQHLFLDGAERIEGIDLVCSGFQPEQATTRER